MAPQSFHQLLRKYRILGEKNDVLQTTRELLLSGHGGYYIALNPEKLVSALQDEEIDRILSQARFLFVDGIGIKKTIKCLLRQKVEIFTGVDLMEEALKISDEFKLTIGLYGAKETTIRKTQNNIAQKFQNIKIAFAIHGYDKDLGHLLSLIESSRPHIVFVALGSPRQERWIHANHSQFPQTLFTGVGGTFDILSGDVTRAPRFVQRLGLEWLFRFLSQPMKRWKRMITLVRFTVLVLKEKISYE